MARRLLIAVLAVELLGLAVFVSYGYWEKWQLAGNTATNMVVPVAPKVPEPVAAKPEPFTLIFGGDVMLGRTVELNVRRYGATWPFANIAAITSKADLFVVNLESPFRTDAKTTPAGSLILRGYPPAIAGLVKGGVDVVSLANNHIPDMGLVGLKETMSILSKNNIGFTGAGETSVAARVPYIKEINGTKLAFLSYTYGVNFDSAVVFYNRTIESQMAADVKNADKKADLVIVLTHFGSEYASTPSQTQKSFARAAINAGATLVIGHHPHVPQPYEEYKKGLIFYSLGNLVFDQQPGGFRDRSALVQLVVEDKKIKSFKLLPYQIKNYGQPTFLSKPDGQAILDRFQPIEE